MNKKVDKMFSFWKNSKLDANNDIGVQRTEEEYNLLLDTIIKATKEFEPWIAKEYGNKLIRENIKGWSFIGRYFDDGDSPLYKWWEVQGNICKVCYKEYGQMYYALNCCKKQK